MLQSFCAIALAATTLALLTIVTFAGFISRGLPEETPIAGVWLYLPLGLAASIFGAALVVIVKGSSWRGLLIATIPAALLAGILAYDPGPLPGLPDMGPRISHEDPGFVLFQQVMNKSEHSRLDTLRAEEGVRLWGLGLTGGRSQAEGIKP